MVYKALCQVGEGEVGRERGGKTTSKSGQAWPLLTHNELQRIEIDGGRLFESHQWCLNNPIQGVRRLNWTEHTQDQTETETEDKITAARLS